MRKKLIIPTFLLVSIFALTACGKNESDSVDVGTGAASGTDAETEVASADVDTDYWHNIVGDSPSVTVNPSSDSASTEVTTEVHNETDTDDTTETTTAAEDNTPSVPNQPTSPSHTHSYHTEVVTEAWDETIVDSEAWDETVERNVCVREAWDEEVYVCTHQMQLDTGEYLDTMEAIKAFCQAHNCHSHKRDSDLSQPGLCGHHVTPVKEYKTVHHDAEYETRTETVHHPAVTHTVHHKAVTREVCSCGAVK